MSFATILLIAVGLAMDAFAVAAAAGLSAGRASLRPTLRLAWHLGLFQFLMPMAGWAAGLAVRDAIERYDHWVAFTLLLAVGGKMVHESFAGDEASARTDVTRGLSLVVVSFATSIDALAVGLSLSMLKVRIVYPSAVIGIVCFALTAAGFAFGSRLGRLFGKRLELAGGLVLIGIGAKIVFEHLSGRGP